MAEREVDEMGRMESTSGSLLSGARERQSSVQILRAKYDAALINLDKDMLIDASDFSEYSGKLIALATNIKKSVKCFTATSRELSTRLQKLGSLQESFEIREERINRQKDAKEALDNANQYLQNLGKEKLSSIDCNSQGSIADFHSLEDVQSLSQQRTAEFVANTLSPQLANVELTTGAAMSEARDDLSSHFNRLPFDVHESNYKPILNSASILKEPSSFRNHSYNVQKAQSHVTFSTTTTNPPLRTWEPVDCPTFLAMPHRSPLPSSTVGPSSLSSNYNSFPFNPHVAPPSSSNPSTGGPSSSPFVPRQTAPTPLSKEIIIKELLKNSIEPFDGKSFTFWSWVGQLDGRLEGHLLTPLQKLQFLEAHSKGEPQQLIRNHLASSGNICHDDVEQIWSELTERYGSAHSIAEQLLSNLEEFPAIRGSQQGKQIQKLYDLCKIINFNIPKCPELAIMNISWGSEKVRAKLPTDLQIEWRKWGQRYEAECQSGHPPFSQLLQFLKFQARELSNNNYTLLPCSSLVSQKRNQRVLLTSDSSRSEQKLYCVYHKYEGHTLQECKTFQKLNYSDRKKFAFESKLCFNCLQEHRAAVCDSSPKCTRCSGAHIVAMHREYQSNDNSFKQTGKNRQRDEKPNNSDKALCTRVCNNANKAKNCSKTVLVEITMKGEVSKKLTGYAIIDEQANVCLVDECVPAFFGKTFPTRSVTLNFASENHQVTSHEQVVTGLQVRGVSEKAIINLPEALTSDGIADTSDEVATPQMVRSHSSISHFASNFTDVDPDAKVLLLIGRNCGEAMATKCYGRREPYVHRTPLGWCLVGNTCISDDSLIPKHRVLKTSLVPIHSIKSMFPSGPPDIMKTPFENRSDDEFTGLSQEDQRFLNTMKEKLSITSEGNIQLPLPMKDVKLPNNKAAVYNRTSNVLKRMKQNQFKLESCQASIAKSLSAGHIEEVPPEEQCKSRWFWWLPIFAVENTNKNKIRLVFDGAAKYHGVCLNDALLQGPNLMSALRGILFRFREKEIAFVCDIEAMFNSFIVPPEQRDLLRFFWFKNNNANENLTEFRSISHIFGARSSPAVAAYGLKFTSAHPSIEENSAVQNFILNSFYVDDGVASADNPQEAIEVISEARRVLQIHNIRLHKIMCNSPTVLQAFPETEVAKGNFSLQFDNSSIHSTLGVAWDPSRDCFVIKSSIPDRPFTKRGVLSVINSLYDPLGLISPVVLSGRLIQRAVIPPQKLSTSDLKIGWDDPLPERFLPRWVEWKASLNQVSDIHLNRCYKPPQCKVREQQLHVFMDASELAIGHVMYLRTEDEEGVIHIAFVHGDSKVAPRGAITIPRLELCAAVDAAVCSSKIYHELERKPDTTFFHCDSQIVLAYLANTEKRFSNYVCRRINGILQHSTCEQWRYVSSKDNPGDIASRGCNPRELITSCWFNGPTFLKHSIGEANKIQLVEVLPEEKAQSTVLRTQINKSNNLISQLCSTTNDRNKLLNTFKLLLKFFYFADLAKQRLGVSLAPRNPNIPNNECLIFLLKDAQLVFTDVTSILNRSQNLGEGHKLSSLSPFVDSKGLLRVGGRLHQSNLSFEEKHPILLPAKHGITLCLLQHYHVVHHHQGRHITHAAMRQAGYHILSGRQILRNFLKNCVTCQKLRGPLLSQQMANLPHDRLEEVPPFSNVGMDVFGHFFVHDGIGTRRSPALKKVWVLIFVCLSSRAVHLEMLPSMDVSSFRNAFSRFTCLRGPCKLIRSDNGTNFTCAKRQMADQLQQQDVQKVLESNECRWELNPPGASHFAGCYERKIGSIRRVLEGALATMGPRSLSRDELLTVLQEAASVVNNTPLWDVSYSPEDPLPLTPAHLLTMRTTTNPPLLENFTQEDLLSYGRKRWRRTQYLAQQFWTRWRTEYIHTLQHRRKWLSKKPCVGVDDVVLVREKNTPRNHWPMGVISSVRKSSDDLVRSAEVRITSPRGSSTTRTTMKCIHDLVLLIPASEQGR